MTSLADYVAAVRALVDELNENAAAGLITHRALVLLSNVDRETRRLERVLAEAQEGK